MNLNQIEISLNMNDEDDRDTLRHVERSLVIVHDGDVYDVIRVRKMRYPEVRLTCKRSKRSQA